MNQPDDANQAQLLPGMRCTFVHDLGQTGGFTDSLRTKSNCIGTGVNDAFDKP